MSRKTAAWKRRIKEACSTFGCTVQQIFHTAYLLGTDLTERRRRQEAENAYREYTRLPKDAREKSIPQFVRALVELMFADNARYIVAG